MRRSHLVLLFVILVALMFAMPLVTRLRLEWRWLITAVLFFALLMVAGALMPVVERRMAWGVLIDPLTNTMSLSRLQIVLWTWLILSAFLTLALARVADAQQQPALYKCSPVAPQTPAGCQPLDIQLPVELWALLGISLTTAVAAPLLKTDKARRTADHDAAADQTQARAEIQFEAAVNSA
jgi:hypothetical protein